MNLERVAIEQMLEAAQVPPKGTLVVHSAFGGLSHAGYRVDPFIEELLTYMNGGNVLMPAMTWRSVTIQNPLWHEIDTASHVGVMPEVFRARYAQKRSIHPTHSASAYGPQALSLLEGHHRDDTPCSKNSPWGRLASADAQILMIGVGFERCTAIHHAEEMIVPEIYLRPRDETEICSCTLKDGSVIEVPFRRHRKLEQDFPQYSPRLAKKGKLKTGVIADVAWTAVAARELMEDAFENLTLHPYAHIKSPETSANLA